MQYCNIKFFPAIDPPALMEKEAPQNIQNLIQKNFIFNTKLLRILLHV